MYIIRNAAKNLKRNLSRNIMLIIMLFIIILAVAISFMLNTATHTMISHYKEQIGADVILIRDDSKLPKEFENFIVPGKELIESIAESKYLKHSELTASLSVRLVNITTIDEENLPNGAVGDTTGVSRPQDKNYKSPNATVFATTNTDISDEFKTGNRQIIQGSKELKENEILISDKLTKLNHLNIGDTITIQVATTSTGGKTAQVNVKIKGIYTDTDEKANEAGIAISNHSNEIFMNYSSTHNSQIFNDNTSQFSVYLTLHNPENKDNLQKEMYEKGLPEYYRVDINEAAYQKVVGPIESLNDMTKIFMLTIIVFGGIVLITLSIFAIRERKYEIGVLRAIGMTKNKVMIGLLSEMFMITGICLVLGIGTAALVSQPIADTLYQSQKNQDISTQSNELNSASVSSSSLTNKTLTNIEISLDIQTTIQIICVGFVLAAISSIAGITYIVRYEPMRILSERDD